MDKKIERIVKLLVEKNANNIKVIDVQDTLPITNYFIICDVANEKQVESIAINVEDAFEGDFKHSEGKSSARWVLVDGGNIIVHVFHTEDRERFNLEKLHKAEKEIDISGLLND